MNLSRSIKLEAWFVICLNILMTIGSIWIFMRMSPAIEFIIMQNEHSLHACEEMLTSLAMITNDEQKNSVLKYDFINALKRAKNNITELEEPKAIESINKSYNNAFLGDIEARKNTVLAITYLSKINREAMIKADIKAKQFGIAGAWGIVFMAIAIFFFGMLFKRNILLNLLRPLEEMNSVINSNKNGEHMRRCTGTNLPKDITQLFNNLNEYLDKTQNIHLSNKTF